MPTEKSTEPFRQTIHLGARAIFLVEGEFYEEVSMTLLEHLPACKATGRTMMMWRVHTTCVDCGEEKEGVVTMATLYARFRRETKYCRSCGKKRGNRISARRKSALRRERLAEDESSRWKRQTVFWPAPPSAIHPRKRVY